MESSVPRGHNPYGRADENKTMIIRKKQSQFEQQENAVITNDSPKNAVQTKTAKQKNEIETINSFEDIDITNIEFKERSERRRGDRRRGYRRIDERTLVSRAQEEAQNIRELASKEGYKNGMQEADKDIAKLRDSMEEFLSSKSEVYDHLSNDILEIALEVAKKIIRKEVELTPDILRGIIQEVFDEIDIDEQRIMLDVHPEEVALTRGFMPEVLKTSQIEAKIIITPNEEIQKGSCKVTTSNGVIDANFSTQLQIIQTAFRSLGPHI